MITIRKIYIFSGIKIFIRPHDFLRPEKLSKAGTYIFNLNVWGFQLF